MKEFIKAVAILVGLILLVVGIVALSAWVWMLLFGVLHFIFPSFPNINYWQAVGFSFVWTVIASLFKKTKTE